jgi:hypothetical protein
MIPAGKWRIGVAAALATAALAAGCSAGERAAVEPNPIVFHGNESQTVGFYVEGPKEYKILEQSIVDTNGGGPHFKVNTKCVGVTLKPNENELKACLFPIESEHFSTGLEAKLETKYEPVGAIHATLLVNNLKME